MPGLAQIGLVRTPGFSSWLIRFITRSKFNHTIVKVSTHKVVSVESNGVQIMDVTEFPNAAWSDFPLTMRQQNKIIAYNLAQQGKPYDYFAYFWIGVGLLLKVKRTPNWVLRRLASDKAWICSQLADRSYQAAGIHLLGDDRPLGCVYPGSFEPLWEDHGWT
jgi:hypothetical protein